MINFFSDPYKDELIYSAIARYHFYSGNIDFRDTIEECFGKRTMLPTLMLGCRLEYLTRELGDDYTSQRLINENTVFPYYSPFIDSRIKEEILDYIKFQGSSSIYMKLGMISGSVCAKDFIYYCPACAKMEINKYGEAYIHREHMLEGILLCPHHGTMLEKYQVKKVDVSRIEYIRLEERNLNLEVRNIDIEDYDKHLKLAKDAYYLLNEHMINVSKEKVFKKYRNLLYMRGLLKGNNTINQRELYEEFISYYGMQFLKSLDCCIDYDNEYNWLKVITRKSKRVSHPLRHLLLINFLCGDIKEFIDTIDNCKVKKIIKRNEVYNLDNADLKKLSNYKTAILKIKESNKNLSRTDLRKICLKEYMYLYRYDKEWLINNLPVKSECKIDNHRVDWNERDKEYLKALKERYIELINNSMIRITKGNLAKPLGILVNIEKKLDYLPLTNRFFNEVCEETSDFQFRRCKHLIDEYVRLENEIKLWKVQRYAGIRKKDFAVIKFKVINYIKQIRISCAVIRNI
ncbi:hypothetical protein DWV13_03695 [Clostridium botulinum]|uniref:TnsD family transposase n=1 Tax=Clostridium TaxID=1485 RepID=UPI0013FA09D0|nr:MULTISPECIES: TnsD family transposase [Clostridium]MCS6130766.1 hypothetical protein [Clostridium botulinum]NFL44727.1 hypothetical protein [Clostridium botulinum]NFL89148.1 hypothetical protein [Clostridium botulinum]